MSGGRHIRKIDPGSRPTSLPSPPSYIGPANPAIPEWRAAGLGEPDFEVIRAYRLERLRAELKKRDLAGALLCDPINIRYATDVANMQVWCLHNPTRYAFVATEGPVVLFDYAQAVHLSAGFTHITETRPATAWFYMYGGSAEGERASARRWAMEIADLVRQHGGGNRRLAVDKCEELGITMLRAEGIDTVSSQEFCEEARKVKHPEEIKAMRRAIHTCEKGMEAMWRALKPGITENQLWAKLHETNIARGGEWIETRLLASGPRTNPWFHECSDRVIEAGDMLSFDTDLIGPYGFCSDISRAWVTPGREPSAAQKALHALAVEHIDSNVALLRAGVSFRELTERAFQLPDEFLPRRYGVVMHGVGLCDEYPSLYYREDGREAFPGGLEAGMVLCVESYLGSVHGGEGVKLEAQVLVMETGAERLDRFPMALTPDLV